jgi:hypothetical protein
MKQSRKGRGFSSSFSKILDVADGLGVGSYARTLSEDEQLRALCLADRLRIAAVDLAVTGARRGH